MKQCSLIRGMFSNLSLLLNLGDARAQYSVSSLESCSLEGYWSMYWLDNNAIKDPMRGLELAEAEPGTRDLSGIEDALHWGDPYPR